MESNHTAAPNIDRQGEPRPLDRRTGDAVNDDDINQGVIDLNERQRPGRLQ
jgi:hypothetical protein